MSEADSNADRTSAEAKTQALIDRCQEILESVDFAIKYEEPPFTLDSFGKWAYKKTKGSDQWSDVDVRLAITVFKDHIAAIAASENLIPAAAPPPPRVPSLMPAAQVQQSSKDQVQQHQEKVEEAPAEEKSSSSAKVAESAEAKCDDAEPRTESADRPAPGSAANSKSEVP